MNDYGSGESWEARLDESLGPDDGWGTEKKDKHFEDERNRTTYEKLIN